MVTFSIPSEYQEGDDIPYKITGPMTASGDTYKIVDSEGNQVDILGSYVEDNDYPKSKEGTIEDADSPYYTLIAYGSRWVGNTSRPSTMTQMFDKEVARFQSNRARVRPKPQTQTTGSNSNSSDSNGSKSEKKKKGLIGLVLTALAGLGVYIWR